MPLLHNEKPQYLRDQARPHYRAARIKDLDPQTHTMWEWVILAPDSDEVAKGPDGSELRWVTEKPEVVAQIKALAVQLNRERAAGAGVKPASAKTKEA